MEHDNELIRVWAYMDKVSEKLDKVSDQIAEVNKAVIRMEAADHKNVIAKLDARLEVLENSDQHRTGERYGADRAWLLLHKLTPWVLPGALATWLVLRGQI